MELIDIQRRALDIREKYHIYEKKLYGRSWEIEDIASGFVGDVGDLMKLIQAKKGIRKIDDYEKKLAHELSDCLWSILVLASKLDIDIEKEFMKTMGNLEQTIDEKLSS